jgi:tetratricopeptide (TPR) repeat protein
VPQNRSFVKNQNYIIGFCRAVALVTIGYLVYQKFVAEPKQLEADEMFVAQENFQQATNGVASDSLYKLSLNGSEGKFGFIKIADEYSGTDAGNLANYYAGMAYLNTGKYNEAIDYLNKFKSDDIEVVWQLVQWRRLCRRNKPEEALKNYVKAAGINKNDFTTPRLLKAGKTALALGKRGCS